MIRNRKLMYAAMIFLTAAVVTRHFATIQNLLGTELLPDALPDARYAFACAVMFIVASLIPFDQLFKKDSAADSERNFVPEELDDVSQHLLELVQRNNPDVPLIVDYTIFQAISANASDIHLDPGRDGFAVRFRIDGMMAEIGTIPAKLTGSIANRLKVLSNLVVYQGFLPQDGRLGTEDDDTKVADFRIAFMPTLHGERIVIRILGRSGSELDFKELGMNDEQIPTIQRLLDEPQGMIILTGPTGSGKTTTIYTALRFIQEKSRGVRAISTLEDPIEYEIGGINQSQVDDKKNFTFDKGLRALLRQDPDVIMVGEIRDLETARIAIQAGMTGHLIITTVHANSTAATFSRLIEMGVAPYSLNTSVTAIIAQRLVRKICLGCRYDRLLTTQEMHDLNISDPDFIVFEGRGCAGCDGSGYQDRHALYEFLEVTEPIRSLVADGVSADAIEKTARKEGQQSLHESALQALRDGMTTPEEVMRVILRDHRPHSDNKQTQ